VCHCVSVMLQELERSRSVVDDSDVGWRGVVTVQLQAGARSSRARTRWRSTSSWHDRPSKSALTQTVVFGFSNGQRGANSNKCSAMYYIHSSKFHTESLMSSETVFGVVTSPVGDDGIPRNPTAIPAIPVNCNTTSVQLTGIQ